MTTSAEELKQLIAKFQEAGKSKAEKYNAYLDARWRQREIGEIILKSCKHDWEWTDKREFTSGYQPTEYLKKTCRRCGLTVDSCSELCV